MHGRLRAAVRRARRSHVPPWDFRVDGVDSISADVHKLGYAPKGASVIAYRTKELRRYQTFIFDGWLGGMYASPNLQGTRAGLPMATAWAVMAHLGIEGYVERTRATLAAADDLRAAVAELAGVRVLGDGACHLVAIASDPAAAGPIDVFAVGDGLKARGWHLDRQGPPDALHLTVSAGNVATMPEFIADLQAVVARRGRRHRGRSHHVVRDVGVGRFVRVVATAGHVDHGKSSLVLALTGTDPDRWAEEKRRGLTIDLGFAHTALPSGEVISFVDVPGHVRFLRNMLAGVGAVDACVFVVAGTEGWKPQSEEHLRILELRRRARRRDRADQDRPPR